MEVIIARHIGKVGDRHLLADATARVSAVGCLPKPEGVGSELADVLIRLLDTVERRRLFPWWMNGNLDEIAATPLTGNETLAGALGMWLWSLRVRGVAATLRSLADPAQRVRG